MAFCADISEQKREEEMLRETNEYLQNLLDYANAPIIVWDPQFRITRFNHAFESLTGHAEADILGMSLKILFPPELADHSMGLIRKTLSGERWETVEIKILHRDESVRTVLWNSATLFAPDGQTPIATIAQGQDITERKQAEEKLKESLALLETTLESTDNGILVVSREGGALNVNGRFTAMWHIPSEIITHGANETLVNHLLPQLTDPEAFLAKITELYNEPAADSFDIVYCKDGRILERISKPMLVAGEPNGRVWSFRDITESKATEQLLRDMQRRESIGILSAGLAHDYNNLLGSMMGNVSLAQSQLPAHHPGVKNLEKALSAMERAAVLTQQMLAYSGKGKFQICTIDLWGIVVEHVGLLKASLPKNVKLIADPPPTPVYVNGDPGQIEQIIMNLIINGGEAIGEKQGVVEVAVSAVHMTTEDLIPYCALANTALKDGAYAQLNVSDNGSGMTQETLHKMFDPFFTTKFTGRGLGLSAALGIIQGHKGGITVESVEGKGTTFRLVLPAITAPAPNENIESVAAVSQAVSAKTILVIDDEQDIAMMAQEMLESGNYKALVELNPLRGIEVYKAHRSEIDMVLVDLTMPEMSGKEVVDALQTIDPKVKIIISSGYSEFEMLKKIGSAKVSAFIQKPYRLQSLLTMVERALH
jgi:PAS domain S-box-containing protein